MMSPVLTTGTLLTEQVRVVTLTAGSRLPGAAGVTTIRRHAAATSTFILGRVQTDIGTGSTLSVSVWLPHLAESLLNGKVPVSAQ